MRELNFGKVQGDVNGEDYIISALYDSIGDISHMPPKGTRYYVGDKIPRSVMRYDGNTWVNEGKKMLTKTDVDINIYTISGDINENMTYSDNFLDGYMWGGELEFPNDFQLGEPIHAIGYAKCKVTFANTEKELIFSNFFVSGSNYDKECDRWVGAKMPDNYSQMDDFKTTLCVLMFRNLDYKANANNFNEALILTLIDPYDKNSIINVKMISINLKIIFKKTKGEINI